MSLRKKIAVLGVLGIVACLFAWVILRGASSHVVKLTQTRTRSPSRWNKRSGKEIDLLLLRRRTEVKSRSIRNAASNNETETVDSLIKRDLSLCHESPLNPQSIATASSTYQDHDHLRLEHYKEALHTFLPKTFSSSFKNPCWFSNLTSLPIDIFSKLSHSNDITRPLFGESTAREVINATLKQTSGEIRDSELYCLPAVFLAGFPKCGTTSLYNLIMAHPKMAKPFTKEGQFWRSFLRVPMDHTNKQMQVLWYLVHFSKAAEVINENRDVLTLDGSASTLWISNPLVHNPYSVSAATQEENYAAIGESVPHRKTENTHDLCTVPSTVHSVLPNSKFIVIMRNPIRRLFSDFWYFCGTHGHWVRKGKISIPQFYLQNAPQVFHNVVIHSIQQYTDCLSETNHTSKALTVFDCVRRATDGFTHQDACYPIRLGISMYYYHIVKWLNIFPMENFLFLRTEDLARDSNGVVSKVWEFLELQPMLHETNQAERRVNVMKWIKLPQHKDKFYMLPETEEALRKFFAPFNSKLAKLLNNDKFLWKD